VQKTGHSLVVANNGEEALAHFAGSASIWHRWIIQMPVMDGITASRIRESELSSGHHVPIMA
jgi:two-component system sensor histidine kinase/response regulator